MLFKLTFFLSFFRYTRRRIFRRTCVYDEDGRGGIIAGSSLPADRIARRLRYLSPADAKQGAQAPVFRRRRLYHHRNSATLRVKPAPQCSTPVMTVDPR